MENLNFNNEYICPTQAVTSYGVTDKYKFQSTKQIIDFFNDRGYTLTSKKICKVRNKSKHGFQKHMLTFDHPSLKIDDGNKLQILVKNSHDGTSSLELGLGVYRLVCSNGLVIGDEVTTFRIKHIGHQFYIKLEESLKELIVAAPKYKELITKMKSTIMSHDDIRKFIKDAAKKRLEDINNLSEIDFTSFSPVREEDTKQDLYTVFNLIQERLMRGGIKYTTKKIVQNENKDNIIEFKNNTTRKIRGIDKDHELNKYLYNQALTFIKSA